MGLKPTARHIQPLTRLGGRGLPRAGYAVRKRGALVWRAKRPRTGLNRVFSRVKRPTGAGFGKRAAARVGSGASPPKKFLKFSQKSLSAPLT